MRPIFEPCDHAECLLQKGARFAEMADMAQLLGPFLPGREQSAHDVHFICFLTVGYISAAAASGDAKHIRRASEISNTVCGYLAAYHTHVMRAVMAAALREPAQKM